MTATEDDVASFVAERWQSLVRFGVHADRCLPAWGRLDPPRVGPPVRKVKLPYPPRTVR